METKLSKLKKLMAANEWQKALSLAAKFHDLGEEKAHIKRGHEAYTNPRFYESIGKDIETLKADGVAALKRRYL